MLSKKLLLIAIVCTSRIDADTIQIDKSNFLAPHRLGKIELFHDDEEGFSVVRKNKTYAVQNCFVDKELRGISTEKLEHLLGISREIIIDGQKLTFTKISSEEYKKSAEDDLIPMVLSEDESAEIMALLSTTCYLRISQMSDGEYSIRLETRLLGGGFGGAWLGAFLGKAIVYTVGHGSIALISLAVSTVGTPAAGYLVGTALTGCFAPMIEVASNAGAMALGTTLMVATGPV